MYILRKTSQDRRDFQARYRCQFCGHEEDGSGYDDAYFHHEVIPAMACPRCNKTSGVITSEPTVPEGVQL